MSRLASSHLFRGVRPWTVLAGVLVLGLAAAFRQAALRAGPTVAAVVAVAAAAALAIVGWSAGSWLFGPVFFYEVIRTGRRSRIFLLRVCFGLCLLLFLWLIYEKFREEIEMRVMFGNRRISTWGLRPFLSRADLLARRAAMMTRLAETFFFTFTCVQFAAIFLLTPAYTAGTIAEEKDRKRFEFLLATDLTNREIVLGKLAACLANLTLIVIWVFGVLAGGLHLSTLPWLMLAWAVYAAAFASLGLWFSVGSSGTLRATLLSLCLMAVLSFGHWLPWLFIEMPQHASLVFAVQAFGLTPPVALGWLAFSENSVSVGGNPMEILTGIGIGLIGWMVLAYVLWRRALARFQAATGRRQTRGQRRAPAYGK